MNGFEGSIVKLINGILPAVKNKEQLANVLPYWLIVLNILGILLILVQGLDDFAAYAPVYVFGVALSGLIIYGAVLMKKRVLLGWRLVFYPLLLSLVINIIGLNLLGLILPCIFTCVLAQIRECYGSAPPPAAVGPGPDKGKTRP